MDWKEILVFLRHLLLGICLSTFNFISSIINILYLNKEGHIVEIVEIMQLTI